MSRLVDTHCHLDFSAFDADRPLILQHCRQKHIQNIVVPGVNAAGWPSLLSLCRQNSMLLPAVGLHPCFVHQHQADDLLLLERVCGTDSPVAIGEIGLDFLSRRTAADNSDKMAINKESQRHYFSAQLDIAGQYHLPVLIHALKAHFEVLAQLKQVRNVQGIIHAYSGSYEQAVEYLDLGFKLGFGGAYSYPRASRLRSLVSRLPLEGWVLETDAPDMSPKSHSGERNSPEYLPEIARAFISLYDSYLSDKQIMEQLYKNTRNVFPVLEL